MKVCVKFKQICHRRWKLVKESVGINFAKIFGGTAINGLRGPRHAIKLRLMISGDDTEVYLKPCQTSKMELFQENNEGLKAVSYFREKALSSMFDMVLNTPL